MTKHSDVTSVQDLDATSVINLELSGSPIHSAYSISVILWSLFDSERKLVNLFRLI